MKEYTCAFNPHKKQFEITPCEEKTDVVRCRYCKHWEWKYEACFVHVQNSEDVDSIILNMQADDFCSKGERKEE